MQHAIPLPCPTAATGLPAAPAVPAVFDRSVLVSNGFLHEKLLATIEPTTSKLVADGIDLSQWFVPAGYRVHSGAQLE